MIVGPERWLSLSPNLMTQVPSPVFHTHAVARMHECTHTHKLN